MTLHKIDPKYIKTGEVLIIHMRNNYFQRWGVFLIQYPHEEQVQSIGPKKSRDGARFEETTFFKCVALTPKEERGQEFDFPIVSPVPGHALEFFMVGSGEIEETLQYWEDNREQNKWETTRGLLDK